MRLLEDGGCPFKESPPKPRSPIEQSWFVGLRWRLWWTQASQLAPEALLDSVRLERVRIHMIGR